MMNFTVENLRSTHSRLHREGIPHDCPEFYKMEGLALFFSINDKPEDYPSLSIKGVPVPIEKTRILN